MGSSNMFSNQDYSKVVKVETKTPTKTQTFLIINIETKECFISNNVKLTDENLKTEIKQFPRQTTLTKTNLLLIKLEDIEITSLSIPVNTTFFKKIELDKCNHLITEDILNKYSSKLIKKCTYPNGDVVYFRDLTEFIKQTGLSKTAILSAMKTKSLYKECSFEKLNTLFYPQ